MFFQFVPSLTAFPFTVLGEASCNMGNGCSLSLLAPFRKVNKETEIKADTWQ